MPPPFIQFAGSLARTTSGQSDGIDLTTLWSPLAAQPSLRVQSNVSAVGGTVPSVTITVEDSIDGGATWNAVGTFIAQTAVGRLVIQIAPSGIAQAAGFVWPFNPRRMRARWTITGTTPSLTFDVKAVPL